MDAGLTQSRFEAIAVSLLSVAKKHGKKYCFVSQKRLEELLKQYHGFEISNRTLNRDLRWMEDNGYVSRLRRISSNKEGKLVFRSTLYKFTGKLFNWLFSLGNRVKRLFSHFRLPKMADYQPGQKQASSAGCSSAVHRLLIKGADNAPYWFYPSTGAIEMVK